MLILYNNFRRIKITQVLEDKMIKSFINIELNLNLFNINYL